MDKAGDLCIARREWSSECKQIGMNYDKTINSIYFCGEIDTVKQTFKVIIKKRGFEIIISCREKQL